MGNQDNFDIKRFADTYKRTKKWWLMLLWTQVIDQSFGRYVVFWTSPHCFFHTETWIQMLLTPLFIISKNRKQEGEPLVRTFLLSMNTWHLHVLEYQIAIKIKGLINILSHKHVTKGNSWFKIPHCCDSNIMSSYKRHNNKPWKHWRLLESQGKWGKWTSEEGDPWVVVLFCKLPWWWTINTML